MFCYRCRIFLYVSDLTFVKNGLCDMSHVGNAMKYGYAIRDNDFGIQTKALREYGCSEIRDDRKITQTIEVLKPGDVVIVWRLDKLASTVSSLQKVMNDIHDAGATVLSLQEQFNSGSATKELFDQVMGAIADAEK